MDKNKYERWRWISSFRCAGLFRGADGPQFHLVPYPQQCQITAQRVTDALHLSKDQWVLSYQSQFGPEEWLKPATNTLLESLAESGRERVMVISPGFAVDCLETLYELGPEGREQFQVGDGQIIPCLNNQPM